MKWFSNFQSNPNIYDLEKAIKELDIDTFTVNQYAEEIQKDDNVLLWTSGGKFDHKISILTAQSILN